ncbi:unnamed protein product [Haemonchus placei]|uniref:Antitoxin n=1 Tax=Haemonchus placei TaxID=6290 RepID=A0A0N4WN73_HAEPC|nr:unnamed protein product [Haemonchus placei]
MNVKIENQRHRQGGTPTEPDETMWRPEDELRAVLTKWHNNQKLSLPVVELRRAGSEAIAGVLGQATPVVALAEGLSMRAATPTFRHTSESG